MKAKRFVPGHISCTFSPVRTDDIRTTGSLGFGIRLSLGCTATVWERADDEINICINGRRCEASVTREAIESMHPDTGLEIRLKHDLPMEQGLGTSASGTYSAALCVADLLGRDISEALEASHSAECRLGGGLGDLMAIKSGYAVPIRESPGLDGIVLDSGLEFDELSVLVFDSPLRTPSVLNDQSVMERIEEQGRCALDAFMKEKSKESLFKASNVFSANIGLESSEISSAISSITDNGYHAGMCMLGNSIFSDAPVPFVREMFPEYTVIGCSSFSGPIIQRE